MDHGPKEGDAAGAVSGDAGRGAAGAAASSSGGVVVQVREKKGPLRAAIPYMPFPVAVICLFLNTFVPGLGESPGRVQQAGSGRGHGWGSARAPAKLPEREVERDRRERRGGQWWLFQAGTKLGLIACRGLQPAVAGCSPLRNSSS